MMAAEEQTTTLPVMERAYRSDADRRRAVDALSRDPLRALLSDDAIASIAEASRTWSESVDAPSELSRFHRLVAKVACRDVCRHGRG